MSPSEVAIGSMVTTDLAINPAQVAPKLERHQAKPINSPETVLGLSGTSLLPHETRIGLIVPMNPPRQIRNSTVLQRTNSDWMRKL